MPQVIWDVQLLTSMTPYNTTIGLQSSWHRLRIPGLPLKIVKIKELKPIF